MEFNDYMDLFLEESKEHLQVLNEQLLVLEKEHENKGAIDEIFRSAHTLKGMSATMGFEGIADLTHNMENLLDKLRSGKLEVNQGINDVLFRCVDTLESMVESIIAGNKKEFDVSGLISDLERLEKGGAQSNAASHPPTKESSADKKINNDFPCVQKIREHLDDYGISVLENAKNTGANSYYFKVLLDETCVMKAVRAFVVFNTLEKMGEIIKSIPHTQEIEDENFDREIIVYFVSSESLEVVRDAINNISEVSVVEECELSGSEEIEEKIINDSSQEIIEEQFQVADNQKSETGVTQNKDNKFAQKTVRVEISKLDKLMNLVGELVINKTRLEQIHNAGDGASLNETIEQVGRIATDLQDIVMYVRMVPIEQVFNRFPRMVRDLSRDLNKEINFIMEGKETELDRIVIDEIGDPLVHLIRNSIDHGIENSEERAKAGKNTEGTVKIAAKQEGNSVLIYVEDDGEGINTDAVRRKAIERGVITEEEGRTLSEHVINNLIFEAGFSTAKEITDISGRGVGLDVVRQKINSLRGSVHLESKRGEGSKFVIKLPLTLAIIQALMIKVKEEVYVVPLANIDETTSVYQDEIKNVQGQQVMVLRGSVMPLVNLAEILDVKSEMEQEQELFVVVVRKGEQRIGLVVSELIGQQEIVINSLGSLLNGTTGIAGAAILEDGTVSLILDISTLF